MKYLIAIPFLICLALTLFAAGVFLAWVFAGMHVSDELFVRCWSAAIVGGFGLFTIFMFWVDA